MITLGKNISVLLAARQLDAAGNSLGRSFERLASGQRINRASDDAAGIAIADSLKTRSRLYGTAARNINDGISALNIASSTLSDQTLILQRLSELAEQAANGTYSSKQRETANAEYQSLLAEFGRLGDSASFNGISLLLSGRVGKGTGVQLQTGVDGRTSSALTVRTGNTGSLSGDYYAYSLFGTGLTTVLGARYSLQGLYDRNNNQLFSTSVTDSSGAKRDLMIGFDYEASIGYLMEVFARESDIGPPGTSIGQPGAEETVTGTDGWVRLGYTSVPVDGSGAPTSIASVDLAFSPSYYSANLQLDLGGLRLLRSANPPASQIVYGSTSGSSAIDFSGIDSVSRARSALTAIQNRLAQVGTLQGEIGAAQSRLASSLAVADVSRENTAAAESRIRNVDVAEESARLTANRIKQQTAAQVLSLASAQPRIALDLLSSI